jgi:hypothetical protein
MIDLECPNCNSPKFEADLLIWGNHFCSPGGFRLEPVEVEVRFDGKGDKAWMRPRRGGYKSVRVRHITDTT